MTGLPRGTALIIGIDAYANGISPLQSAVRDARAIAAELESHHAYAVTLLLDDAATASAIACQLEEALPAQVSEDSCFLLYFAGHGVARGDGASGPQGFLLPHAAQPRSQDTWLSMERVRAALSSLPCKHLLVVLDCCFAGSFRWSSTRDAFFGEGPLYDSQYERYLKGVSWQALTSAAHDEKALDVVPGSDNTRGDEQADGHSPFASALLRGLRGEADTSRSGQAPDGVITAIELYQYIFDELVPADARSHQTPGIWPLKPDNTGQYVFHSPLTPKRTLPDPPLDDSNNPWCGLRAYAGDDAPLFFGRERVVDALFDHVLDARSGRLLAVVGASGTGKSSVVKAGLIPRLQRPGLDQQARVGRWRVIVCARLAADPMAALASALPQLGGLDAGERALLLIDQFEELYTHGESAEARDAFLRALRQLINTQAQTTVVLTLRSDFEPRPAGSAALRDLWAGARYLVPAMTVDEFRECTVRPAQVKAVYFEPDDLIDRLLDEVMSMPGALPLLSFALTEIYRQAQLRRRVHGDTDRALTAADYENTGGVVGGLHQRASALYEQSEPATRATIRRVFLRLLTQDGARLTRRRVSLQELEFGDAAERARVKAVVEQYVGARLLVADGATIEPAHDTLIVAWVSLLDWLSEAGPQTLHRAVWHGASSWAEHQHSGGMLWHDNPQLPLALSRRTELNGLEIRFVTASERRRRRRRAARIAIASAVALTILAFLFYGLMQALDARQARLIRDQTFLNIIEKGSFFDIEQVLKSHAQGGVVEPVEGDYQDWRLLVVVDELRCGFDAFGNAKLEPATCAFAIGKVHGRGRVMALGHEALITYIDWSFLDNLEPGQDLPSSAEAESSAEAAERAAAVGYGSSIFLDLALQWLDGEPSDEVAQSLAFSIGHREALAVFHGEDLAVQMRRLEQQGYAVRQIEDLADPEGLAATDVLIVGNAWAPFSEQEIAAIEAFVADGGGLLMAGLGWSWIANGPHPLQAQPEEALAVYPMNQLARPFGAVWTDQPIWTLSTIENTDGQQEAPPPP